LTTNRIPTDEPQIVLQPRAYADTEWWRSNQVDNVLKLMDAIKRKYNVDENRVSIAGASDGGTGVWFWAMRQATPFANCTILIGHPLVLANPDTGADQQLYPANAVNCPVFAVNGGIDPLYPADSVVPFVRMYERAGVDIVHHIHPDAGHTTSWWPEERPLFEKWASTRPRTPNPSSLSWETDRTDRYNREKWLVINTLGKGSSDVPLQDVNTVETGTGQRPVFERRRQGGRVDVTRTGNAFAARTRGVRQFTLLLSPEVVDFSKPVTVSVNGRQVFSGPVRKSVETLMKWNARDNDRTMLYGAELAIAVP
jgi:predicted esterase